MIVICTELDGDSQYTRRFDFGGTRRIHQVVWDWGRVELADTASLLPVFPDPPRVADQKVVLRYLKHQASVYRAALKQAKDNAST